MSEAFKQWRESTGLTQEEFAERVGISQAAVSHYESGRRIPDLESFRKIWRSFPGLEPLPLILMFIAESNHDIN